MKLQELSLNDNNYHIYQTENNVKNYYLRIQ